MKSTINFSNYLFAERYYELLSEAFSENSQLAVSSRSTFMIHLFPPPIEQF